MGVVTAANSLLTAANIVSVRPIMSAPGPRPGNSGNTGSDGSSPLTTAVASQVSVPGNDPLH